MGNKRVINLSNDRYKGIGKRIRLKHDLNDVESPKIYVRDASGNITEAPDTYTTIRQVGKMLRSQSDPDIYGSDEYNIGQQANEYFNSNPDKVYMDFDDIQKSNEIPLSELRYPLDEAAVGRGVIDMDSTFGLNGIPIFGSKEDFAYRQQPFQLMYPKEERPVQKRKKLRKHNTNSTGSNTNNSQSRTTTTTTLHDILRAGNEVANSMDPIRTDAVKLIMSQRAPRWTGSQISSRDQNPNFTGLPTAPIVSTNGIDPEYIKQLTSRPFEETHGVIRQGR